VEINKKAPVQAQKEILVNASPESVWKIHADINGWSDWNPDISFSKLEGELAEGAVFNWKSRKAKITSVICDLEPGRRIAWTGQGMGVQARHVWTIEPNGSGTILKTEESMEGWLVNLMKGRMRKVLESSLDAWLIDLKTEAEMEANGNSA
jgi:hypothetical protein